MQKGQILLWNLPFPIRLRLPIQWGWLCHLLFFQLLTRRLSERRKQALPIKKHCPYHVIQSTHALVGEKTIRAAFKFGSIAEGSEKADSDIDLLVIGDEDDLITEDSLLLMSWQQAR